MLLMLHILLISLFSFWYLSVFFLLFLANSYVSRYSNINYGTTSLILIHYNNIWFPCIDLSVPLDHNVPQNLQFFHFQQHLLEHVHTIFNFFSGCISHTISNELFLQHYHVFSCTPFVPTFYIRSQYEILFHFSFLTFYKVVIGLFYLCCLSHNMFKFPVLARPTTWLPFQLSNQLFSVSSMFHFHPLILAFLLQNVHTFFFIHSSFFSPSNSVLKI